ncbi:MAG: ABC transporter ATP-binding protein/permease [Spirochaetaceae bacterium]|jgi:ATP-binding cassette subfamily B protein|nr:ABC transporter ATP-binding protein/permease [Spirochaetaceae bacterium]
MSDSFEGETYVKSYDGALVKRIMAYLKPYSHFAAVIVLALAVSTAGELAVPVLQQRLIDGRILPKYIALNLEAADDGLSWREALSGVLSASIPPQLREEVLRIVPPEIADGGKASFFSGPLFSGPPPVFTGKALFIAETSRLKMSASCALALRNAGILDGEKWYAFRVNAESGEKEAALAGFVAHNSGSGGFFSALEEADGTVAAAIRLKDMDLLSASERELLRGGDLKAIVYVVFLLLSALLVTFAATFTQMYLSSAVGQRIMKDIRLQLYSKTINQSSAFLSRNPVGRIVSRVTSDVETINDFFTSVLTTLLKDLALMVGVMVTMIALSPRLALAAALCMPPVLVITIISRVKARSAFRDQRAATSAINSYLSERISGMSVVQMFCAEEKSEKDFEKRNSSLLIASLREIRILSIFRPSVEFISIFTTAAVIAAGAAFVLNLSLSIGVLIAFINLTAMFFAPVLDIAEKYTILQSAMAGAERVFALLDVERRIPDAGKIKQLPQNRRIEFSNVHFSYEKGEEALKGLSFCVEDGETAAITGFSGAGKTTITNLIPRLWDIDSGALTIGGIPVRDFSLPVLRASALPVLQDVFLFSFTVAENISLGLDISREQIESAAKAAYAHDFIMSLENGYDTRLCEGAANISQGQRQLISFARVIAHNPSIIILDEATSSIDAETESLVQSGLKKVLRGRTSIVIAHRLSTIRGADKILVLSGGVLAECGGHEELIAKNGIYAGLYQLQFEEAGIA